jgi:hypothetical protein
MSYVGKRKVSYVAKDFFYKTAVFHYVRAKCSRKPIEMRNISLLKVDENNKRFAHASTEDEMGP